jgi:hypothetical protein
MLVERQEGDVGTMVPQEVEGYELALEVVEEARLLVRESPCSSVSFEHLAAAAAAGEPRGD